MAPKSQPFMVVWLCLIIPCLVLLQLRGLFSSLSLNPFLCCYRAFAPAFLPPGTLARSTSFSLWIKPSPPQKSLPFLPVTLSIFCFTAHSCHAALCLWDHLNPAPPCDEPVSHTKTGTRSVFAH